MAGPPPTSSNIPAGSSKPPAPPPLSHHTSEMAQRYGRADHLVYHNEGPEGEVTKFRHLFKRPAIRQVSHLGHPPDKVDFTNIRSG